jgi:cell division protein FtsW
MGNEPGIDLDFLSEPEQPRQRSTRRPRPDRRSRQGLAGFISPAPKEKRPAKASRIFQAVEVAVDDPVEATRPRSTAHARPLRLSLDVPLILVICTLIVFGLLMVYSASWKLSLETSDSANSVFWHQFYYTLLGLGLMVGLIFFNYHYWQKLAVPLLFTTLGLLIAVLLIHDEQLGATRSLFGGSVQPSEIAKIMIVIYLAVWVFSKRDQLHQISFGLGPLGVILGVVGALIYLQPDLSAAIMIFILGSMMFFLGGGRLRQIALVICIGVFFIWFIIVTGISSTGKNRFDSFIQGLHSPMDASSHVQRSMESFVKGGAFGVGIGKADSKLTVLPFPQTDSIFAVVGEETGVVGATLLVGLYLLILWRGLNIARRAPDQLGMLLASGLILWVTMEAMINMAVMIGLLPFAGNALPLMSAGGSNRVVTLVAMGIVLNVSRQSEKAKVEKERSFSAVVDLRRRDWRRSVSRSRRSTSSQIQD